LKFHYFSKQGQKSVAHFQGAGGSGQGSTLPSSRRNAASARCSRTARPQNRPTVNPDTPPTTVSIDGVLNNNE
jgi:hypothetical protein